MDIKVQECLPAMEEPDFIVNAIVQKFNGKLIEWNFFKHFNVDLKDGLAISLKCVL